MNQYEIIGHVATELSKGTKMENLEEKLVNFYGPKQCKKWIPMAIALINRAGKQTEC